MRRKRRQCTSGCPEARRSPKPEARRLSRSPKPQAVPKPEALRSPHEALTKPSRLARLLLVEEAKGSRDQSQISPEPHKARSTKFPGAGWRHGRGSRRELLRQFEIGPSVQTLRIITASGPCGDREDDWRSVGPSRCVPPADRGADDRALAHSEMLEPAVGYLTALYGVVRAGYAGGRYIRCGDRRRAKTNHL